MCPIFCSRCPFICDRCLYFGGNKLKGHRHRNQGNGNLVSQIFGQRCPIIWCCPYIGLQYQQEDREAGTREDLSNRSLQITVKQETFANEWFTCRINQRHKHAEVKSFQTIYDMPIQSPYIYAYIGTSYTIRKLVTSRIIQRQACHTKFAKVSCTLILAVLQYQEASVK